MAHWVNWRGSLLLGFHLAQNLEILLPVCGQLEEVLQVAPAGQFAHLEAGFLRLD